jgi:hypothetical protein
MTPWSGEAGSGKDPLDCEGVQAHHTARRFSSILLTLAGNGPFPATATPPHFG